MKKIIFSLVALVAAMSMNAQIMKVYKDGAVVASYTAAQMDSVVYEEVPAVQSYSVTFAKGDPGRGNSYFTGWNSSTITASNDDVTVELALSGARRDPIWNDMGDIQSGDDAKLTITVTPEAGVTVTGIEYKGAFNSTATKTGAGPWEFTVEADEVSDGSTGLGPSFQSITVNYEK